MDAILDAVEDVVADPFVICVYPSDWEVALSENDYEHWFDTEATVDGERIDVRVAYSNNEGDIDIFRLGPESEPCDSVMVDALERERLFLMAEDGVESWKQMRDAVDAFSEFWERSGNEQR